MSREQRIIDKIKAEFLPTVVNLENESHKHHAEKGAESHFKLTVVSDKFTEMRTVARHKAVYACLQEEFDTGLHALALHLFTPNEWKESGETVPRSPSCTGLRG